MVRPDRDPGSLRIQGGKLFIDLCETGDRIGVIDFSTDAKIIFPLYEFLSSQDKETLKGKIETIVAKGDFTDLTLALDTAFKEMARARTESIKAVILLTDGEMDPDPGRELFAPHNVEYAREIRQAGKNREAISSIKDKYKKIAGPIATEKLRTSVLPGYKDRKIPIFAIAFGPGADIPLLREIADVTATEMGIRNFYFIDSAARIQAVFSEIVEQLKKSKEKISEQNVAFAGEEIIHKVHIDDFVREVNFKFIFGQKIDPSEVNIVLKTPEGNIISRNTAKQGIGHIFEKGYELFNIFNPLPGTWEARISGKKDVKLDITISTWGRSDLKIVAENAKSEYYAGESVPVLASLQLEGKRVASSDYLNNLKMSATIENPKNAAAQIDLFDDGRHSDGNPSDGIYGNSFTGTNEPGDYFVNIQAQGKTAGPKSYEFVRAAQYKVRVVEGKVPVAITTDIQDAGKGEKKFPFPLIPVFIAAGILALILLSIYIIRRRRVAIGQIEEEMGDGLEDQSREILMNIPLKIKTGKELAIGSGMIDHPSIGEKNLFVRRDGVLN
jgi:ribosome-associated translation inhibitor RaiA